MLSENFQWCLGNYAVISRNHLQLKAIQGGLNRDLAKLRYVPRKHLWKRPLQKINPNFKNFFETKSTSSICVLIFSIGNEPLQIKFVTVKFKTTRDTYVTSGWSFIYLSISQVRTCTSHFPQKFLTTSTIYQF